MSLLRLTNRCGARVRDPWGMPAKYSDTSSVLGIAAVR